MTLFEHNIRKELLSDSPLSSRMRPESYDEFIGQEHILGENKTLRNLIESKTIPSMVLWGPPGTGKTTLAKIISEKIGTNFRSLSAVSSGLSEIRKISEEILNNRTSKNNKTILFLDEIHRFSKSQQDSLLPLIEEGIIILIGATTENPGFSIINPLLSRVKVFKFEEHTKDSLRKLIQKILDNKKVYFNYENIEISEETIERLILGSNGDARKLIDTLELSILSTKEKKGKKSITNKKIDDLLENNSINDKISDNH